MKGPNGGDYTSLETRIRITDNGDGSSTLVMTLLGDDVQLVDETIVLPTELAGQISALDDRIISMAVGTIDEEIGLDRIEREAVTIPDAPDAPDDIPPPP